MRGLHLASERIFGERGALRELAGARVSGFRLARLPELLHEDASERERGERGSRVLCVRRDHTPQKRQRSRGMTG